MKKVLHKITSFIMALVVMFSTLSFTVDMHYCGSTLVDTALFTKAKSCGMQMQTPSTTDCSVIQKNCCSNKQLIVEGQDELQVTFNNFTFEQQVFVTAFFSTYINLFEGLENHIIPFKEYSPPLVVRDIHKLDEVYLI